MMQADRSNVRRGRRIIAWAAASFLLVQFVLGLLLDYRWPQVRFPSAAAQLRQVKARRLAEPDILFLGTSRFGCALRPDVIQPRLRAQSGDRQVEVMNGSVPAGDGFSVDFLLSKALELGMRPKLVVVEMAPEDLARGSIFVQLHIRRQATWTNVPSIFLDACASGQILRLLAARTIPLFVHRREIWRNLEGTANPAGTGIQSVSRATSDCEPEEPTAELATSEGPPPSTRGTTERWLGNALRNYRVRGAAAAALEHVLARCQAEGIDVILVAPAVWSMHRAYYTPAVEAAYLCFARQLEEKYGCRFIDCRADVPDQYFQDTHHTHPVGGWYFSRKFTDEVLVPYWKERRAHQAN